MAEIYYKCSKCGKLRKEEDLNGYDPTTNDYSRAYCRKLAECKSLEADKVIKKIQPWPTKQD